MGRLMKYELRSTMKLFIPLWLAVLVLAGLNRLRFLDSTFYVPDSRLLSWLSGIAMFLYVIAILGVFVVALIFVIQRFYQGLLKDEGYLTFTLPVRTDSILWAKTFSAMILIVGSVVVCVASILLLVSDQEFWKDLAFGWQFFLKYYGSGNVVLACILGIITMLVSIIPCVQYLYLSMSIGHLAQKHRVGASVLAYVGINILLSLVTSLLGTPIMNWLLENDTHWNLEVTQIIWLVFSALMILNLIQTAIFYFPTRYILTKRLNLE